MFTKVVALPPYELIMEQIRHEDGKIECKLSVRVVDGVIASTVLPHKERLLASTEEWAEFINVEVTAEEETT